MNETNKENIIISLTDENNNCYDATLLTIFQAGNYNRNYAALLSHIPDSQGTHQIQIFRCNIIEQDEISNLSIENIQSDMEYEEAYNVLINLIE